MYQYQYQYQFTPVALRQLKKLPRGIQKRIINKLDFYCQQPNPLRYADFLVDTRLGQFRFRVGDYRVVFDLEEETLIVLAVGHRREIYQKAG